MVLESDWYIACKSKELVSKPLGVTILQKPVVVFRTSDGKVAALEDRCAQRHADLSEGKVCQDSLECPYHNWKYSTNAKVVQIPALPVNTVIT
ncbi:MAG: Rieske 2Fe-2S domain-containing protein [Heteroscytonema crispum UTEX LB 1556]